MFKGLIVKVNAPGTPQFLFFFFIYLFLFGGWRNIKWRMHYFSFKILFKMQTQSEKQTKDTVDYLRFSFLNPLDLHCELT